MALFFLSFLAGVLTTLAPCTISLLPVIVGGTLSGERSMRRALTVTLALAASVVIFTLALKASTFLISVPPEFWQRLSGGIIFVIGVFMLFPKLWEMLPGLALVNRDSNQVLASGYQKQSFWGDVIVGAALGPVFSSCSPTYFLILATVLPQSFATGFAYLLAYAAGLCSALLVIVLAGQKLLSSLGVASDPYGWLKRGVGAVFLLLGAVIFLGLDKQLQVAISSKVYDVTKIEQMLLLGGDNAEIPMGALYPAGAGSAEREAAKERVYERAPEITNPSGYVNTRSTNSGQAAPITISEFKGKKVVLVDFWTYSCINCQRTFPYLRAWNEKYKDQGLEIIGIHTPEFAFEKLPANVQKAVQDFGLTYPSVLDNDYGTWRAFSNQYWPRKYLIDIDGFVVYDHAGEGDYEVTERAIQSALAERAAVLGEEASMPEITKESDVSISTHSPETYFGALRNENFGSGERGVTGKHSYEIPGSLYPNTLYLAGEWGLTGEYAESLGTASIYFDYSAKGVYFVAGAEKEVRVEVLLDDTPVPKEMAGADIFYSSGKSYVKVKENRLYKLIDGTKEESHVLHMRVPAGLEAFTFTFG